MLRKVCIVSLLLFTAHQPVMSVVLEAMTNLLLSSDDEVLRISSLAMGNFAIYGPGKLLMYVRRWS